MKLHKLDSDHSLNSSVRMSLNTANIMKFEVDLLLENEF